MESKMNLKQLSSVLTGQIRIYLPDGNGSWDEENSPYQGWWGNIPDELLQREVIMILGSSKCYYPKDFEENGCIEIYLGYKKEVIK